MIMTKIERINHHHHQPSLMDTCIAVSIITGSWLLSQREPESFWKIQCLPIWNQLKPISSPTLCYPTNKGTYPPPLSFDDVKKVFTKIKMNLDGSLK